MSILDRETLYKNKTLIVIRNFIIACFIWDLFVNVTILFEITAYNADLIFTWNKSIAMLLFGFAMILSIVFHLIERSFAFSMKTEGLLFWWRRIMTITAFLGICWWIASWGSYYSSPHLAGFFGLPVGIFLLIIAYRKPARPVD